MGTLVAPEVEAEFRDWLFTLPAFYAEFAPLPEHRQFVDHLYAMRDCGTLTPAGRSVFASPFKEVCFTLRDGLEGGFPAVAVVVVQPTFGHRKRKRPLHGWALGIRSHRCQRFAPDIADRLWMGPASSTRRTAMIPNQYTMLQLDLGETAEQLAATARAFVANEIRRWLIGRKLFGEAA